MTPTGSSLPRRMLGRHLRELRERSGVSAEFARDVIGVGKQTLWRMETGQPMRLNPLFIEKLCEVYGASEHVTQTLLELTNETRKTGWWHALDDTVPRDFCLFAGLESTAKRLISYQPTLLPALLQTDEYRRALIWNDYPTMPGAEVERRISVFGRRKVRLDNDPATFSVEAVIDECALRRAIGGPSVMADQLIHLVALGERKNVSIRVIPLEVEAHSGLRAGPFAILEFPKHPTPHLSDPPIVHIQGLTGDLYLEKTEEIRQYRQAYADIERSVLDESQSRALLQRLARQYGA
ncbi:helix-turn-helix domain-containing protein [Nocardia arizonensis]|uniref:helix-turn-helix domain-containing protein n=1 Tax=Nocardia arizonensis TaxID=1141647 RepID=UPI0006D09627|nr:helix-turn-helix transcriptional regulator [Nocardia arizonensis]